jgi:hypothetical protein
MRDVLLSPSPILLPHPLPLHVTRREHDAPATATAPSSRREGPGHAPPAAPSLLLQLSPDDASLTAFFRRHDDARESGGGLQRRGGTTVVRAVFSPAGTATMMTATVTTLSRPPPLPHLRLLLVCRPVARGHVHPGRAFSGRLAALNGLYVRMETQNAYVSTLGGGAFLCRHLPLAVRAANTQMRIARILDDARLGARAAVHLVYIAVAAGRWRTARRLLRVLARAAREGRDEGLAAMVSAARRYRANTVRFQREGLLDAVPLAVAERTTLPAMRQGAREAGTGLEEDLDEAGAAALLHGAPPRPPPPSGVPPHPLTPSGEHPSLHVAVAAYARDPRHYDDLSRQRVTRFEGPIVLSGDGAGRGDGRGWAATARTPAAGGAAHGT